MGLSEMWHPLPGKPIFGRHHRSRQDFCWPFSLRFCLAMQHRFAVLVRMVCAMDLQPTFSKFRILRDMIRLSIPRFAEHHNLHPACLNLEAVTWPLALQGKVRHLGEQRKAKENPMHEIYLNCELSLHDEKILA